ncbi:uncharacterized protein LOC119305473 [Triticum dicoccoides]|uniref:uncharacterized protein LOC119305473 n=1 Tax=Triticum dicoccoides TaxID=85692 RepID=UPI001890B404|nr:uncharacterized protein LOC119305473 [Triticum dicoccoides]XP_044392681.1 uncharacterized protein LOC123115632 [Triticum aestivum]
MPPGTYTRHQGLRSNALMATTTTAYALGKLNPDTASPSSISSAVTTQGWQPRGQFPLPITTSPPFTRGRDNDADVRIKIYACDRVRHDPQCSPGTIQPVVARKKGQGAEHFFLYSLASSARNLCSLYGWSLGCWMMRRHR